MIWHPATETPPAYEMVIENRTAGYLTADKDTSEGWQPMQKKPPEDQMLIIANRTVGDFAIIWSNDLIIAQADKSYKVPARDTTCCFIDLSLFREWKVL